MLPLWVLHNTIASRKPTETFVVPRPPRQPFQYWGELGLVFLFLALCALMLMIGPPPHQF